VDNNTYLKLVYSTKLERPGFKLAFPNTIPSASMRTHSNVYTFIDPTLSLDCYAYSSSNLIRVECTDIESLLTTGFQVIAQLSDPGEVHKLYINESMDLLSTVTVNVERTGEYQVSIFSIEGERGILDSVVAYYRTVVTVTSEASTITTQKGTT
jgi:hypothetical protein